MKIILPDSADVGPLEAQLIQSDLATQSNDTIRIKDAYSHVNISFQRTLRVPDDQTENHLPADLGTFPLYSARQYQATLPSDMAMKGGLFFPMYQREAMWINFSASEPFAIQIYAGTVNAISGEPIQADFSTTLHRLTKLAGDQSIQDYIVPPHQLWLDGIASKQGCVRQFVAVPLGSGYTVEAQVTGKDVAGGLQLQVIPSVPPIYSLVKGPSPPGAMRIFIKTLTDKTIGLKNVTQDNTTAFHEHVGIREDRQRFLFAGKQLEDDLTIGFYGIREGGVLYLVRRLRGGGGPRTPDKKAELGIAPGGLIKQCIIEDPYPESMWDIGRAISFNIQILNSQLFSQVTGMPPPATPISAQTYISQGLPFFDIYNETSTIVGGFDGIRSVGAIDAELSPMDSDANDFEGSHTLVGADKPTVQNPVILLNPDGTNLNFKPVSVLKAELKRLNHAQF
ncbi:MAG: hypothetical protein Q9192_006768 [Flavoplaca navasiana]